MQIIDNGSRLGNVKDPEIPLVRHSDMYQDLFDFVVSRGAIVDAICIGRDKYGGRGLFATRPIPAGGIVAVLPRTLRIGQRQACERLSLPSNTPDLSALSLLLMSYVNENSTLDPRDNWGVYGRTLPSRSEFTNGAVMSLDDIKMWACRGEEYSDAIYGVQKRVDSCTKYIRDFLSDEDHIYEDCALRWAVSMVLSRTHSFGSKKGRWLTPLLDMANHCPVALGGGTLSCDDQGGLVLRAGNALKIGDDVTMDYQCEDDAQMVATYGFSNIYQCGKIRVI